MSAPDYQPRTPERLIEILRSESTGPRSWQAEAAAVIEHRQKAIEAERERCAAIADKADEKDERDNGLAATGAAEVAARWIRNGVDDR
jgi:hypothetical protein